MLGQQLITNDDLVLALLERQQIQADDGGLTVTDLIDKTGLSCRAVRNRLKVLKSQGRLQVVDVQRIAIDDRRMTIKAYRLLSGKENAPAAAVFEEDLVHTCGRCGSTMDIIRPGKWQCPQCD